MWCSAAGQIGAALGLALAVSAYGAAAHAGGGPVDPVALTSGVARAFWVCAALMACAALTARFGLGPVRRETAVAATAAPAAAVPGAAVAAAAVPGATAAAAAVPTSVVPGGYAPSSTGLASDQPPVPVRG